MKLSQEETALIEGFLTSSKIATNDQITQVHTAGGGCISKAIVIKTRSGKEFFVKYSISTDEKCNGTSADMFSSEMEGLEALRVTDTFKVPKPLGYGQVPGGSILITEKVSLKPLSDQRTFGTQLARLHLFSGSDRFGLDRDNFIGITPQPNTWNNSWVDFLRMRLEFQFARAQFLGHLKVICEELLYRLPEFFRGIEIKPSLLHGDLWCGNCGEDETGQPVIYDPAVYWGHSEAELGIMRMFGGFADE
ncbi:hypothetical protein LPJ73_003883, partial [Coemansia sp. RSA 2703]